MYTNYSDQLMDITVKLELGTKAICESREYQKYLNVMSHFHSYSASNCLLILMQKPDATYIAGYNTWQKQFSRNVRRGEKAIRIIAPVRKQAKENEEKTDILHFRAASVFDISQTEGKPLPYSELKKISGDVEQFDIFLKKLCRISPVPVIIEDTGSHAHGYYDKAENKIIIAPDLPEPHMLKTAVHEIAHAVLHNSREISREQMEVEAESVAYVVMKHYGIDTSEYSFPYIALWSSSADHNELRNSMELIRSCSNRIITDLASVRIK